MHSILIQGIYVLFKLCSYVILCFQASACAYEDLKLIASFLDDPDKTIKMEALNALKAFTSIWKFKIRIQVTN